MSESAEETGTGTAAGGKPFPAGAVIGIVAAVCAAVGAVIAAVILKKRKH